VKLRSIEIQNYRRWSSLSLDLADLGGAVLTGDNGTGKSSIIEAILWALYGVSRSPTVDGVVKIGQTDAAVTVIFDAAGERYRVVRKRTTRSRGKSELDLYRHDGHGPAGEVWTPLSGKNLADTQAEIERVLGVSYETLVAASVVQQGDAGRFTRSRPEERRAVLRAVLNLETWKDRARLARERARTEEAQADALARDVEAAPRLEAEHAEAQAALERLAATLTEAQERLDAATAHVATAREHDTAARAALQAAEARAAERPRLERDLATAREELAALDAERARLEAAARLDDVEQAERNLPAARERVADAERRLAEAQDAAARRADLEAQRAALVERYKAATARRDQAERESADLGFATIAASSVPKDRAAKARADAEVARLDAELEHAQAAAGTIDERPEIVEAKARRAEADRVQADAVARLDALADAPHAATRARAAHGAAAERLEAARKRAELLSRVPCSDADGWTPVDGLGPDVREGQRCDLADACPLLADARAAAAQVPTLETAEAEARAAADAARDREREWEAARKAQVDAVAGASEARLAVERAIETARAAVEAERQAARRALQAAQQTARDAATALAASEAAAARLPAMEAAAERAAEAQAEAETIAADGRALKARIDAIEAVDVPHAERVVQVERGEVERLERTAARRTAAEAAAADLARLPERRARLDERIETAGAAIDACAVPDRLRLDAYDARDKLALAEVAERDARRAVEQLREEQATQRAAADRLAAELAALAEKRAEVERRREVAAGWRATVEACELAPTLLIERAIPVLEAEANRVLADISPRGMQVRIDTQRALKSGDGMAETLDIIARDDAGERPYEDYSGGEQFRLDIALRLALAKLLADREGVPVEWLVIDEGGFGALDAAGKAALKDAVAALQPRYALILLVTHIEEIADALPHRLHVEDDGAGGSRLAQDGAPAALAVAA
jgi:exonuclease SbcC